MTRIAFIVTLGLLALLSGCSKPDGNVRPPHALTDITAPSLKLVPLWTAEVGGGAGASGVRMQPAFADDMVFVASADGYLKALDVGDGDTVWEKTRPWRPDSDISYSGGPVVVDGVLVMCTLDGHVYTYEAKSGRPLWQAQLSASVLAAPAVAEHLILVRTNNGKLTALNRNDGSTAWVYDQAEVPALSLRGNGNIAVGGGVAFIGTDDGKIVAVRLDNGEPLWEQRVSESKGRTEIERLNDADGRLLLDGTTLYATSYHGNLVALDARSGQILWQHEFSSYVGVALSGATLVGVDDQSNVWAWNTYGGSNLWKQDGLSWRWLSPVAIQNGHAVVGDSEGWVHWLNLTDGSFAARARVAGNPVRAQPLVLADGRVIVADISGNLSAWQVSQP